MLNIQKHFSFWWYFDIWVLFGITFHRLPCFSHSTKTHRPLILLEDLSAFWLIVKNIRMVGNYQIPIKNTTHTHPSIHPLMSMEIADFLLDRQMFWNTNSALMEASANRYVSMPSVAEKGCQWVRKHYQNVERFY